MLCLPICLSALQFISTMFYSFRKKVLLFSFLPPPPFLPFSFLSSFFLVFLILDKSFATELPPPHSSHLPSLLDVCSCGLLRLKTMFAPVRSQWIAWESVLEVEKWASWVGALLLQWAWEEVVIVSRLRASFNLGLIDAAPLPKFAETSLALPMLPSHYVTGNLPGSVDALKGS